MTLAKEAQTGHAGHKMQPGEPTSSRQLRSGSRDRAVEESKSDSSESEEEGSEEEG
jgi:hypothetical protein